MQNRLLFRDTTNDMAVKLLACEQTKEGGGDRKGKERGNGARGGDIPLLPSPHSHSPFPFLSPPPPSKSP